MKTYTFTFRGVLQESANPLQVRRKLARLFGVDEAALDPIFSHKACFQRQGLDQQTATLYQQSFESVGAIVDIESRAVSQAEIKAVEEATLIGATRPEEDLRKVHQAHSGNKTISGSQITDTTNTTNTTKTKPSLQQYEQDQHEEQKNCPKCGSFSINSETCLDCGVYFSKLQAPLISAEPEQKPSESNQHQQYAALLLDPERQEQQEKLAKKASYWLSRSIIAIIGLIIADRFLQGVSTPTSAGIDIGYIPYIIAHCALVRACFLYAEYKHLPTSAGFLGVLSILGVGILMLWADREHDDGQTNYKALATVLVSACVFVYWVYGYLNFTHTSDQMNLDVVELQAGREEYPSTILQADAEVYRLEHQQINAFVVDTLNRLSTQKYRPDQVSEIAATLFAELARYEVWRGYQYYLHVINNKDLPEPLTKPKRKADQKHFSQLLESKINAASDQRLLVAKSDWLYGSSPDNVPLFWTRFNTYLNRTYDAYRNAYFRATSKPGRKPTDPVIVDLSDVRIKPFQKTKLDVKQHHIEISAQLGPMAGKPLAIGFYLEKYVTRRGKTGYMPKMKLLSPVFPYQNFSGMHRVFHDYSQYRKEFQ